MGETLHAIGVDIYGRLVDVPLANGRSTTERSTRDEATPVVQFELRGARAAAQEKQL